MGLLISSAIASFNLLGGCERLPLVAFAAGNFYRRHARTANLDINEIFDVT